MPLSARTASTMGHLLRMLALKPIQRAQGEDRHDQHDQEEDRELYPVIEDAAAREGTVLEKRHDRQHKEGESDPCTEPANPFRHDRDGSVIIQKTDGKRSEEHTSELQSLMRN